ncbi:MAG: hypothetical protein BGO82_12700 [Devosia sp. 67-54]|uniref:hypothetical protein n=1 Tax=unclassified Devosia TaxID=196773 RepID=UPI000962F957|nr:MULTISPECIES: hypothetical protein [unclassified Devosia]MBN9304495.1 hypothetical protein [Devosia sp.]OJX15503.1 MAG: hypothetical protein BGO82_12700 [Devosia sp. 67-54]
MFRSPAFAALLAAGLVLPAAPALAINSPPHLVAQCESALDMMSHRIVRKETVRAIGPKTRVHVMPFCMGIGPLDFGNASGLGKTIGANPVLAKALARSGFRADDVTNITISGNSVTLYVHRE